MTRLDLLTAMTVVVLSWLQYLYVRRPSVTYTAISALLIAALTSHLFGLWEDPMRLTLVAGWSLGVGSLMHWFFFSHHPLPGKNRSGPL